jgi:hypothetical protein
VKQNLIPEIFREFLQFITSLTIIDEDIVLPFELGVKYEAKGLKPADAFTPLDNDSSFAFITS